MLRRWLHEPLLHFAIGGAVLFWLYGAVDTRQQKSSEVVVDTELRAILKADHQRRTGKPPSAAEEQALVERYVEQELLFREALTLGLDQGDLIVRRRLVQKMEMILEHALPPGQPSDEQLQEFLRQHAARYTQPARLSLTQVFVSAQRWGDEAAARAAALRGQLLDGTPAAELGDPFLHGNHINARSLQELGALFGPQLAAAVFDLPAAIWSQPLRSAYGLHLVRVEERSGEHLPPLDHVRGRVHEDWLQAQREAARAAGLQRLRARYQVRSEGEQD